MERRRHGIVLYRIALSATFALLLPGLPGLPGLTGLTATARGADESRAGAEGRPESAEDREAALLFNTASHFYRQKNWRDAANAFGDFLKRFPRHRDAAEARFAAGYCANRVGDHAGAVELLRLAVRDEGTAWSADASFYLGRSLEALAGGAKDPAERGRRLAEAAESYGRAAGLYASMARGEGPAPQPSGEGTAKAAEGSPPAAAPAASQRERSRDLRVLALGAQGEALYQAEKHAEAARALEPLLAEAAGLVDSQYYHRGVYVLGLARHAAARAAAGAAPTDRVDAGPAGGPRFAAAREALEAASAARHEKESLWEEAAFLLARLTHQDGELPRAIEAYGRVVKRGGGRAPEAAYYRGLALYETQDPARLAQAREELGRFLKDFPGHALTNKVRFYEALSAFDLKDYPGCEAAFQAVASASQELAGRALLRRGQALLLKPEPTPAPAAEDLAKAAELLEKEAAATGDPTAAQRAAEALYWKGEALSGASKLIEAAQAYGDVHSRHSKHAPDLAEKGLYQMARTLYLAGKHAQSLEASDLYRTVYPAEKALFHAESLLLAGECAFHAPAGAIQESLRREAPRFYAEAAAALKDAAEARRARYMSGVSLYFLGEHRRAAETLGGVRKEMEGDAQALAAFPELPFYLADALALEPRRDAPAAEDRERWKRAVTLYGEYLERSRDGSHIPNALVNLGLCQEWLEDHDGARKTFERFLTGFPNHELSDQVRFELGNARLVLGDLEAAALAYASAADGGSPASGALLKARALYQKAMLERRLGKPSDAAGTLAALLERHGEGLKADGAGAKVIRDARYQRSIALLEAGKGDDARAGLAAFLASDAGSPQEAEARNQLARSLLDAGKPEEALKALGPLLEGGPASPGRDQALYLAAWCHAALSPPGRVSSPLGPPEGTGEGAVGANPERAASTAEGTERGAAAGKHQEEMEATYRRLIAEHPQSPLAVDAMLELGQHLFNRKAYAESKKWLSQVREILESDQGPLPADGSGAARSGEVLERALFGLGFIAYEEGDFAATAKLLDRVASNASSPLAARAAFQAGRALSKTSDQAGAAQRFARVADELKAAADPELLEEGLLRLGECLHQLRKYDDAVKVLDRGLAEHAAGPLRHEVRFARGFALQLAGNHDGAVEAFRAVVAGTRAAVAARAQYHIGECRMEQGRHREAAREFSTTVANFDFE
ncbi:MAG: tetratricopeptide repeat protein, partial [Planctomycetes bacterium]|nr:tetratricopeptide repeat protein [Planctomycetota bacterium]